MEDRPKYINPLTDYGFKKIFGNAEVMAAFLNDLLKPESKICEVIFADKEMLPQNKYERGVIYDLRCRLEDESEIIVEMQKTEQEFFADRILYYLSRSISAQGYKGRMPKINTNNQEVNVNWDFELKPVYGIFFMNFSIGNLKPCPFRKIGFRVEGSDEVFCDKIRAYTIELPEYRSKKEQDCTEKLDYWTYILNNMENLSSMPFVPEMPIFDKVANLASTSAMTPDDFNAYMDSVDAYRTTMASFKYSEKKGIEKGIEIGMEKGMEKGMAQERINNAKAFLLQGFSLDIIVKTLHLSDEEVANIKKTL